MKGTFDVRGRKVRISSERRYVAVLIDRPSGAGILKRSDSLATMRVALSYIDSTRYVVIDTTTGQEVELWPSR